MPRFEVYIPAVSADFPVDLTLRVTSENWLAALKVGLEKICGARMAANVLCDVMDDGSVEVTDPASGKVFRIVEIPAVTPVGLGAPVAPPPAAPAPPPPDRTQPLPQAAAFAPRPATAPPPAPPPAAPPRAPAAPPRAPAPPAAAAPGRPPAPKVVQVPKPMVPPPPRRIGRTPQQLHREEVLADLFVRVPKLYELKGRNEVLGFLLDLAMEKIACEAGFVLLSRGDALVFAVGRGAKAAEVLKAGIPVPAGTGITGFCVQELVGLAVSDVEKDPRFFREISRAVGYETRSLLCSPVVKAGRVYGAVELKNRQGGSFDPGDLAVLAYLAHQAASYLELREASRPL